MERWIKNVRNLEIVGWLGKKDEREENWRKAVNESLSSPFYPLSHSLSSSSSPPPLLR